MITNFDQNQSTSVQGKEREVMVRFRTRFHGNVIFSELQVNKERSLVDRSLAVGDPEPKMFLPSFWPPSSITNEIDLQKVSLLKMIYIIDVGLNMRSKSAAEAESYIQQAFPQRQSLRSDDVYSCQVSIVEGGEVVYRVEQPEPSSVHPSLRTDEKGKHSFVKAMVILSLRQYLERSLS